MGSGNVREGGVGVFCSWDFVVEAVVSLVPGRVLCVDCWWHEVPLRLVNVYAPCGRGGWGELFGGARGCLLHQYAGGFGGVTF